LFCRIRQELDRLEKNQARRKAREQQKELLHNKNANVAAGSPGASGAASGDKIPTGTTRKCANCGQVGHIKTNKKYAFSPPYHVPIPQRAF
jgi:transcription initiation factor TFIID subunit 1